MDHIMWYLLLDSEDDICAGLCVISSNISLVTSSVGHQKYLSQWYSWWEGLHRATVRFYCSRGSVPRFASWTSHPTVWNSLWEPALSAFNQWFRSLVSIAQRKTILCFGGYRMGIKSSWLCMWMILWLQKMTQKRLTGWRSTYRSNFRPRFSDSWSTS